MSPHTMSNFVHDLVEMARATEEVPQLRQEVETLKAENTAYFEMIQRLELQAIDRKNEIDNLNGEIRSLEVERDDASFCELEAQDKVNAVTAVLTNVQVMVVEALAAIGGDAKDIPMRFTRAEWSEWQAYKAEQASKAAEAAKMVPMEKPFVSTAPQPVALPSTGLSDLQEGSGSAGPIVSSSTISSSETARTVADMAIAPTTTTAAEGDHLAQPIYQGVAPTYETEQSAVVTGQVGPPIAESEPVPLTGTILEQPVGEIAQVDTATYWPYAGRRYINFLGWVSRQEWLAGGGTDEDYDWRPTQP